MSSTPLLTSIHGTVCCFGMLGCLLKRKTVCSSQLLSNLTRGFIGKYVEHFNTG